MLSRSDAQWNGTLDGAGSMQRVSRNVAPHLHPPARATEVHRAIQSAKVDKMLARPFLFALQGHSDGIYTLTRSRKSVAFAATGSADGEVRLWHLPSQSCKWSKIVEPASFVRGVAFTSKTNRLLACTDAAQVYSFSLDDDEPTDESSTKMYTSSSGPLQSISACYDEHKFATASSVIKIWDESRSEAIQSFTWGIDTLHHVCYNPVETTILASCASDRSIAFYDTRLSSPVRKLVLRMRSNTISWNPIEAYHFTVASDDHNLYTYDMRRLGRRGALVTHKGHVGPVMAVDYSPTGREFCTGSYDSTIRIFPHTERNSREVYHTKRMQKVFGVNFSGDGAYVISGSDDGDVRVWKSERSRPVGPLLKREKQKIAESEKLIDRYAALEDVRNINRKRHLPRMVLHHTKEKKVMEQSRKRKERNIRKHTRRERRPKRIPESLKNIVKEIE